MASPFQRVPQIESPPSRAEERSPLRDPNLWIQIVLGILALGFGISTIVLAANASPSKCESTSLAVDPTAYAVEATASALAHSKCPSRALPEPIVADTTGCYLSDDEWMRILVYVANTNYSTIDRFLEENDGCDEQPVMTNVYGLAQQADCPFELRVLRLLSLGVDTSEYTVDAQAVWYVKSWMLGGARSRSRQLKMCDAILDCDSCWFGFRVNWVCVRDKMRAAYLHVRNCGFFGAWEPHKREYCEQLARAALD